MKSAHRKDRQRRRVHSARAGKEEEKCTAQAGKEEKRTTQRPAKKKSAQRKGKQRRKVHSARAGKEEKCTAQGPARKKSAQRKGRQGRRVHSAKAGKEEACTAQGPAREQRRRVHSAKASKEEKCTAQGPAKRAGKEEECTAQGLANSPFNKHPSLLRDPPPPSFLSITPLPPLEAGPHPSIEEIWHSVIFFVSVMFFFTSILLCFLFICQYVSNSSRFCGRFLSIGCMLLSCCYIGYIRIDMNVDMNLKYTVTLWKFCQMHEVDEIIRRNRRNMT